VLLILKTDNVTQDKMASWHDHAREVVSGNHTSSLCFFVTQERKTV